MDLLKDFQQLNEREHLTDKYPLYSQDAKKGDTLVIAKYFFPASAATWYVFEASRRDDDVLFFGLVTGLSHDEMGFFTLSQLADMVINVPCIIRNAGTGEDRTERAPTKIERDLFFTPDTLANVCPDFVASIWGERK